jgi:hypothetical protein
MIGRRAAGIALAALLAAEVHAGAIRVPEDYPSILTAVDAAVSGDSVLVGPGTWTDTDTRILHFYGQDQAITSAAFLKPGVALIGTAGPAVTIVAGTPTSRVFTYADAVGTEPIVVEGFTATGLKSLLVVGVARIQVSSCWFVDNTDFAAEVGVGAHAVFRDCVISGNCWDFLGGYGVSSIQGSEKLEFYDCEIRNNFGKHAMRVVGASQVIMDGCTVMGHTNFGACVFEDVPDLQVRNCVFLDNRDVGVGAGVDAIDSFGIVEFCVFARDSAQGGGGFAMTRGSVRVESSTFYACDAEIGSAMEISGNDPGMRNNIIAYSKGGYGAVDRTQGANHPTTGCNLFWGNEVPDYSAFGTWTPSPTDVHTDPQFCDPTSDDFALHSSSPGAPGGTSGCGSIGALGVGCGSVSIERMSWGRIKDQYR